MNKKERRLALRTALQSRVADLVVVQEFGDKLARPKTKDVVQAIARWGVDAESRILLILAERTENVYLSVRNMPNVKLISATNLNIHDLLTADKIVSTSAALEKIQEVYGG
jgi:large subunit ribosomal protein L4